MNSQNNTRKRHIHVMVVDDHPLMREGIVSKLGRGQGIKVVGEAANGKELIDQLNKATIDVILLDLQMPDMNGPQTIMYLTKHFPQAKVLVLSMFNEKRMIREMFRLGARGYLTKDSGTELLIDGIFNVYHRGYHAHDEITKSILSEVQAELSDKKDKNSIYAELKERDLKVLSFICEGLSSEEIAPMINVSKHTVDLCRAKLIAHFGAKNVVHLVAEAIRLGIYIP
jgi:DNA-binding NarL/FixJ family response regulator